MTKISYNRFIRRSTAAGIFAAILLCGTALDSKAEISAQLPEDVVMPTFRLACATTKVKAYQTPTTAERTIQITSQSNIQLDDYREVVIFDPFEGSITNGAEQFGLICAPGWSNTGCAVNTPGNGGTPIDYDIHQKNNGCFVDDEEVSAHVQVYTTCCKVIFDRGR